MSGLEFAVLSLTVVLASCLQGSIGFGMGMVAAPIVALLDPGLLPGMLIILALLMTMAVAIRERAAINLRGAGWALIGRLPGTAIGAYLVAILPHRWLALLLAAVVLLGVALASFGWRPVPTPRAVITAGAASGLLGTATSIGGPPMALVWQGSSGARLRATMSAFFLVGSAVSLAGLALAGAVDRHVLSTTLAFVPAVGVGYVLSRYVNLFLTKERLRWTGVGISCFGAVLLIVDQIR
ncbi:sulfite exporter TauE/SafE family protein [Micromonospora sp. ATA32]|nr:sulfite exporter TauE/SafE family protein [Micromonospora sp. ATA32]